MSKLSCGKKDVCVKHCEADVDVKVKSKPKVRCYEVDRADTKFDIALKIKADQDCTIRSKGHHRSHKDPCAAICLFEVNLPVKCEAKVIQQECKDSHARYHLDVDVPFEADCKVRTDDHCPSKKPHHDRKPKKEYSHDHSKDEESSSGYGSALRGNQRNGKYVEALSRDAKTKNSGTLKFKNVSSK